VGFLQRKGGGKQIKGLHEREKSATKGTRSFANTCPAAHMFRKKQGGGKIFRNKSGGGGAAGSHMREGCKEETLGSRNAGGGELVGKKTPTHACKGVDGKQKKKKTKKKQN